MAKTARELASEQADNLTGFGELAKRFGSDIATQVGSGIKGLSVLPQGMDAAADAVRKYQSDNSPGDPSPEMIRYIQSTLGPLAASAREHMKYAPPIFQAARAVSHLYPKAVSAAADMAGRITPQLGGAVGAVGESLPYAGFPEGAEAKAATDPFGPGADLLAKYSTAPIMDDGTSARTLAREGEAARRRAQDGLPPAEPEPSEFQGRQAEHEGAVARRMSEPPPYVKTQVHPSQLDPSLVPPTFSAPDSGKSYVAMDPQTGEQLAHVTVVPRGDGVQAIRQDTKPGYQGQGIGHDLLSDAISDAHGQGLDFHSDTQLSVPAARTFEKVPGAVRNEDVTHALDPSDGDVGISNNGRPVYSVPKQVPADEAEVGETPHFNPNSYIGSQAFAGGGEVGAGLDDIAALVAKYSRPGALEGAPTVAKVGATDVPVGPNPGARQAAANYMSEAGIKPNPQTTYVKADPARGKAIADAFEAMPHSPDDPATKASYEAMVNETLAQYQHMKKAGVNVEFMPPGQDPYAASPRLMLKDLADNNHMYVYPTNAGFGSSSAEDIAGNPLLADSGEHFGGVPATNNDVFRAVHDYFGHAKEGVGFRADGEENAWQQHARMYSDQARPAMTTETRGQNSWVNFGPHGEANKTASGAATVYAPQKTGLLPSQFSDLGESVDPDTMHFLHMSNLSAPEVNLDPAYYGTGMRGAEARRGGTKTISLYPADIDPKDIEDPLKSKTPYRVSVPSAYMYDMSADPLGLRSNAPSYSDAEDAVKDAGYMGYHTPDGQGIFRGQGRLFEETPATRISPAAAPVSAAPSQPSPRKSPTVNTPPVSNIYDDTLDVNDFASGGPVSLAEGGELSAGLDDIGNLISKYVVPQDKDAQAVHLLGALGDRGSVTYNPTSGDIHDSGYAVPHEINRSVSLDSAPTADDIHDFMTANQDAFENPKSALHIESDDGGNHFMHVAHVEPDYEGAVAAASSKGVNGIRELHTGRNLPISSDATVQANIW